MLDADGSFSIVKDGNGFKPQVSISNSCRSMLEWCAGIINVPFSISKKRKEKITHKQNWDIKWTYNHAVVVSEMVLPYLLVKRERALCIVEWINVRKRNGRYTSEELIQRDALIAKLRHLNQRGCL
jgi:hypothetical protein